MAEERTDPTAPADGTPLLRIGGVSKHFGGLQALKDIDLDVERGTIVGLIGPNGAGKTTLFNLITGIFPPSEGGIVFDGRDILHRSRRRRRRPFEITRAGIGRTFQNIRLFAEMTALENVTVGADAHHRQNVFQAILRTPRQRREDRDGQDRAEQLLEFAGIHHYSNELAGNLSYGDQRRVEIARALATDPKLLLLDEPAAGMNPTEKGTLTALIRRIQDQGITILIIEHDMRVVMGISQKVAVLDYGEKIAEGEPSVIQRDARVVEAYLGRQNAEEGDGKTPAGTGDDAGGTSAGGSPGVAPADRAAPVATPKEGAPEDAEWRRPDGDAGGEGS
jgi:ABC-type branched-subunit amino acid transport system ATPase component